MRTRQAMMAAERQLHSPLLEPSTAAPPYHPTLMAPLTKVEARHQLLEVQHPSYAQQRPPLRRLRAVIAWLRWKQQIR